MHNAEDCALWEGPVELPWLWKPSRTERTGRPRWPAPSCPHLPKAATATAAEVEKEVLITQLSRYCPSVCFNSLRGLRGL